MKDAKRILIALNDKELILPLEATIKSWGYDVTIAKSGKEVFENVSQSHPYAIIVDDQLEDTDGFRVSKALKENSFSSHIPVIMLIDKKQARKKMLEIEQGVDDYLIKPPDPIDLEIRIELAKRSGEFQFYSNSLTKLPGAPAIEKIAEFRIENNKVFSFMFIDIDNFKSFNDKYGYAHGDAVILQTARIISMAVKKFGLKEDFVGHIGGDDFALIIAPENEKKIAEYIIEEFNRLIPFHYNHKDRHNNFIIAKDRTGKIQKIPLMTVSIAIVDNKKRRILNFLELTEIAFEIKRYLKTLQGSNFLINRRHENRSENNLSEDNLLEHNINVENMLLSKSIKPLGQRLLDAKLINEEQLNGALVKHWTTGRLLGEVIIDLGIISKQDLEKILYQKDKARSNK